MNYYWPITSVNFKEISEIPLNKAIRVVSDKAMVLRGVEEIFAHAGSARGRTKAFIAIGASYN